LQLSISVRLQLPSSAPIMSIRVLQHLTPGRLFLMPQQLWNPFLHASDPLIVPLLYVRPFINPFPFHTLLHSHLLSHWLIKSSTMASIQPTKDPLNLNEWKAPVYKGFDDIFSEQFKASYNIEDVCRDLGFKFYNNTKDRLEGTS
jgi:hypothetical protein